MLVSRLAERHPSWLAEWWFQTKGKILTPPCTNMYTLCSAYQHVWMGIHRWWRLWRRDQLPRLPILCMREKGSVHHWYTHEAFVTSRAESGLILIHEQTSLGYSGLRVAALSCTCHEHWTTTRVPCLQPVNLEQISYSNLWPTWGCVALH